MDIHVYSKDILKINKNHLFFLIDYKISYVNSICQTGGIINEESWTIKKDAIIVNYINVKLITGT